MTGRFVALALFVVLGLIVVGCSRSVGHAVSVTQTRTQELSLKAGQRGSVAVDLSRGQTLDVTVTIVGDQSVDIGIWIENPAGSVVVQEKRGKQVLLSYGAVSDGRHHVIVNNGYSLTAGKTVSLRVEVGK
jgi:uncharacterized protein YcgI (DUF1989 family)